MIFVINEKSWQLGGSGQEFHFNIGSGRVGSLTLGRVHKSDGRWRQQQSDTR